MAIVFEKGWVQSFSVIANGETIALDSIVSARLYSAAPTAAQKADHLYAAADAVVATTTSGDFTDNNASIANSWLITMPAVDNPDPTKSGESKQYWLVISYVAESGDDTQSVVETVDIYYPESQLFRFSVTKTDVYYLESKLETLKGDTWTTNKVGQAEILVLEQWKSDGVDREYVKEDDGDTLVKFQAAVLACNDLSSEPGDVWAEKREFWSGKYDMSYSRIKLNIDADRDRTIGPDETAKLGIGFMAV